MGRSADYYAARDAGKCRGGVTESRRAPGYFNASCDTHNWMGPTRTSRDKAREDLIAHKYKARTASSDWAGLHRRGN